MKAKKISTILVSAVFALVTIGCLIGLFSVRKVNVNYAVSNDINTMEIQNVLDDFVGENLLFFNTDKVEQALQEFYYTEIVSVEKAYPNVLEVSIRERKEVYFLKVGDIYAVTTKDGVVLRTATESEVFENASRDKILLSLDGVTVEQPVLGKKIKTNDDDLMQIVFDMAKSVSLTDCIKSISVFKPNVPGTTVTFNTYSGVDIEISRVEERGVEMAIAAFNAYDNADSDYVKMFSVIKVYLANDAVKVVWTSSN